ncbi:unnamed protein product [Pleuronectes platessa]|uniref:Uncharacterized protein n=1 Tax=Pleuronectes platessa TaxID=8262 RepID=A0A9N7YK05_PLEPL|nr:unnamed protein product [Pleuronectes platessa]
MERYQPHILTRIVQLNAGKQRVFVITLGAQLTNRCRKPDLTNRAGWGFCGATQVALFGKKDQYLLHRISHHAKV